MVIEAVYIRRVLLASGLKCKINGRAILINALVVTMLYSSFSSSLSSMNKGQIASVEVY